MSNLVDYAKEELKRIGMIDSGDPYNDFATKSILDLIELFSSQDHTGFTAPYVAGMFHRLAMFKPVSPLTGEDDEWNEVGTGVFQNKRCFSVFKDKDGTAYNIEGKVFSDDGDTWYLCKDSRVNVTFPYVVPDQPEHIYRNKDQKMRHQMQIVIDIPEEEYEEIISSEDCGLHELTRAITWVISRSDKCTRPHSCKAMSFFLTYL